VSAEDQQRAVSAAFLSKFLAISETVPAALSAAVLTRLFDGDVFPVAKPVEFVRVAHVFDFAIFAVAVVVFVVVGGVFGVAEVAIRGTG